MATDGHPALGRIMILMTIIPKDKGDEVSTFYRTLGLNFNMISPCYGAGGLEFSDYLGLTETEKDMVISVGPDQKVREALSLAKEHFHLNEPGHGIAFTLPINGISGPRAYSYVTADLKRSKE